MTAAQNLDTGSEGANAFENRAHPGKLKDRPVSAVSAGFAL